MKKYNVYKWTLISTAFCLLPLVTISCEDYKVVLPEEKLYLPGEDNGGTDNSASFQQSCETIIERINEKNSYSGTGKDRTVEGYLALMKGDGSFSDVDYMDRENASIFSS